MGRQKLKAREGLLVCDYLRKRSNFESMALMILMVITAVFGRS
jgi:hypothetical protein